jgi:hypothetical protein
VDDNDYVSVAQAMHELKLRRARVLALVRAGRLQAAIRDGRQVILRASIEQMQRRMRGQGLRPAV